MRDIATDNAASRAPGGGLFCFDYSVVADVGRGAPRAMKS